VSATQLEEKYHYASPTFFHR